ncbi:YczE/YyaS/YitT family protein [Candidatus Clostridium radicumherbarum]|uniref:YitT family protein n=1 Tax=Candidatus Clostridium radicumherbarum TaxID=3381662 RepID=A0ABW8TVJ2_9CLOT
MNVRKLCITFSVVLISILLTGIGVAIFVECGLGSDTLTVLLQGLHKSFNISFGTASRICNSILLLLALLISRKKIGLTTVIFTLTVGYAIDFVYPFIQSLVIPTYTFIMKIGMILIAQLCFALCYSILIQYQKGMHSIDAIIYFFVNKFKVPYILGRTIIDITFTISGLLLGGVAGIGTIIACCTTGIMVDCFLIVVRYKRMPYNSSI